jgi:hypothetical protein
VWSSTAALGACVLIASMPFSALVFVSIPLAGGDGLAIWGLQVESELARVILADLELGRAIVFSLGLGPLRVPLWPHVGG